MRSAANPRGFLDSNVIFSGLYSTAGAPAAILDSFIQGRVKVILSQQVLDEVIRTIRDKLPEALSSLQALLMSVPPEIVKDPSPEEAERWADILESGDAAIVAAAIAARPDYLVTGDRHFLDPGVVEGSGLRIVTPAQLLESLR